MVLTIDKSEWAWLRDSFALKPIDGNQERVGDLELNKIPRMFANDSFRTSAKRSATGDVVLTTMALREMDEPLKTPGKRCVSPDDRFLVVWIGGAFALAVVGIACVVVFL